MLIYHDVPFFCGIHNDVTCFLYMVGVMIARESLRSEALTAIPGHRLAKNQCESVHDVMDWISLNSIGEFWFAAKNRPKSAQHSYKLLERTTLPLSQSSIGDTTQSSKLRNGLSTFRLFHSADSQLLGLTELSCCICRCCLLNSVVLIDSIILTSYRTLKIPLFHKLPPFSSISLTVLISCEPIRPGRGQPGCQGQHWMSHGPNWSKYLDNSWTTTSTFSNKVYFIMFCWLSGTLIFACLCWAVISPEGSVQRFFIRFRPQWFKLNGDWFYTP